MKNSVYILFYLTSLSLLCAVFPSHTFAIPSEYQQCNAGDTCKVGEFVFDDTYLPVTNATCNIKSIYPDGTVFVNTQPMTHISEGWYEYDIVATGSAGLYRTNICCTVSGENMCLDKSFEVATSSGSLTSGEVANAVWNAQRSSHTTSGSFGEAVQNIVPSTNDIAAAVWGYSGRTLTSFGTLVSDVWAYSTRSLTTFGSLASDMWAVSTRTLTGVDLSSGTIATKSDIEKVKSEVSSIIATTSGGLDTNNTKLDKIDKTTQENRLLLEQIVNKPIIQNFLEDDTVDLQVKLDNTKNISTQLYIVTNQISAKLGLVQLKWNKMTSKEVLAVLKEFSHLTGEEKSAATGTLFKGIEGLRKEWDMALLEDMSAEASAFKTRLGSLEGEVRVYGKTKIAYDDLAHLSSSFKHIESQLGQESDTKEKETFFGKINQIKYLATSLDKNSTEIDTLLTHWKVSKQDSIRKKATQLVKNIELLNSIPQAMLALHIETSLTEKQLKNKILGMKGVIAANRKFLARSSEKPLANTWLEEGSIVFKSLVTNPSLLISQTIPLKYYLPKEVKKEQIIKIDDDLTVTYDSEKDQYFVSGEFTLAPEETRTISITVDENVFMISPQEIESLRKQSEQLATPLKSTSFFAQGVTLQSDIEVSLNKILSLQENSVTPESRIRSFRESQIELEGAKVKMEKLKELVAQAGSAGSLMGFVGGAQVLGVWGLIIIIIAGFVSLGIYMHLLRRTIPTDKKKTTQEKSTAVSEEGGEKKRAHKPALKYLGILASFGLLTSVLSGTGVYVAMSLHQPVSEQSLASVSSPTVLAAQSSASSLINTTDTISSESAEIDMNEEVLEEEYVQVKENPAGFLRVRKSPGGVELAKLSIGEKVLFIQEDRGWSEIEREDGTNGWVSNSYIEKLKEQTL